jgi:hypothetical protein
VLIKEHRRQDGLVLEDILEKRRHHYRHVSRHAADDRFQESGQRSRKDNYSMTITDWSRSKVMYVVTPQSAPTLGVDRPQELDSNSLQPGLPDVTRSQAAAPT